MKTYLLLRSNKQSGPYSFDELLTLGLRAQDLLWAEGKSASWRYPSELDEFRAHVPAPVTESLKDNQAETVQAEATVQNPAAKTPYAPAPDRESFHFHPRIRSTASPFADKETLHFHPRIHGGAPTVRPAEGESRIFPTLSRFMTASGDQSDPSSQGILAGSDVLSALPTAAFQPAKPPADGEDEIPSLALQTVPDPGREMPIAPKPASVLPRINVTLPAAVADKTMVIIQRREQLREKAPAETREPLPELRTRPVLEFLDDAAPAVTEPAPVDTAAAVGVPAEATIPAAAAPQVMEPALESVPVEQTSPVMELALESVPVEQTSPVMEPALESLPVEQTSPVMEPALESVPVEQTSPLAEPILESVPVEQMPPIMDLVTVETGSPAIAPADPGSSAEPYQAESVPEPAGDVYAYPIPSAKQADRTGLLQKIAVAAAIVSLVSVAALIANSVFNPDAYNYQTKTKSTVPAKSLPARPAGVETPAAEAPGEANRAGSGATDTDQSANQGSPTSPADNHAKPAVRKIE